MTVNVVVVFWVRCVVGWGGCLTNPKNVKLQVTGGGGRGGGVWRDRGGAAPVTQLRKNNGGGVGGCVCACVKSLLPTKKTEGTFLNEKAWSYRDIQSTHDREQTCVPERKKTLNLHELVNACQYPVLVN